MPNNVLVLPRVGDLVSKHTYWQYQGQNYIARLTGNDPKYGFRRNFLQLTKHSDGHYYFSIADFARGGFYEIRSRGVSGAFIVNSIYECVGIAESGVKLAEVEKSHVVRELTRVSVKEPQPVQATLGTATGVGEATVFAQAFSTAAATSFESVTSTVLKKPAETSEKPAETSEKPAETSEKTSEKPATRFVFTDLHHVAIQLLAIAGSKEAAKSAIDAVEPLVKPDCVIVAKV